MDVETIWRGRRELEGEWQDRSPERIREEGNGGRRLLRPGCRRHRRAAARGAAIRRRLELRGAERLEAVGVQHHDLRAGGAARAQTSERWEPGGERGASARQEYLRSAGVTPEERVAEATALARAGVPFEMHVFEPGGTD
jgi:hypothetical protein